MSSQMKTAREALEEQMHEILREEIGAQMEGRVWTSTGAVNRIMAALPATPVPDTVNAGLLEAAKTFVDSEPANRYPDNYWIKLSCVETGELFNNIPIGAYRRGCAAIAAAIAAAEAAPAPVQTSELAEKVTAELQLARSEIEKTHPEEFGSEAVMERNIAAVRAINRALAALSSQDHSPGGLGSVGTSPSRARETDSLTEYRGWLIEYRPPPIPSRACDWQFWHRDYDGSEDNRCGAAASLDAAKAEIDEMEGA